MDDYTNACVFKEHKACYRRSERRDLAAYQLAIYLRRRKQQLI